MRENGGRTPSPGRPTAAPLTAGTLLSMEKGTDRRGRRAGGAAGRPPEPIGAHVQLVIEFMVEAPQNTSPWSRTSFSKSRQSATSVSLSNGLCSRPEAV